MDFSDSDLFFGGRVGEEVSGSAGEEGFAGARRARNEDIVVAGDGDGEGAFGEGLAANVV